MYISHRELSELAAECFAAAAGNTVPLPSGGTLTIFDAPLTGSAAAGDPLFESFRSPEIIGPGYMPPREWLPEAESVVSFAFPYTLAVRESNRQGPLRETSREWTVGRFEGESFLIGFARDFAGALSARGCAVLLPGQDPRFGLTPRIVESPDGPDLRMESRWSERHAAYAAGLGTFGLSRGLITERGMAVRFISLITDAVIPPTPRIYARYDEYCTRCGACIRRCPAEAISLSCGKNNIRCREWVEETKTLYAPRYGCGKCQTGVPCEAGIPARRIEA